MSQQSFVVPIKVNGGYRAQSWGIITNASPPQLIHSHLLVLIEETIFSEKKKKKDCDLEAKFRVVPCFFTNFEKC